MTVPTSLTFQVPPNHKILELGGGDNPRFRPNVDVRPGPNVDFTADFDQPLPIQSNEWDSVYSAYVIEHLSWRKVRQFVSEVYRILKFNGKFVCITANTEAQIEWIKQNPQGWDGKSSFDSFSCVLFGDQDYPENAHKNFMSPDLIKSLMLEIGFDDLKITPYGARATDMVIEATKRATKVTQQTFNFTESKQEQIEQQPVKKETAVLPYTRTEMFDKSYFNGGGKVGGYAREGYWDYPVHNITAEYLVNKIKKHKEDAKVLELGCARGYIVKRLQDQGIKAHGVEISLHCWLTRVADDVVMWDICQTPWPFQDKEFDICYSVATLEHIPEAFLPDVVREIERVSSHSIHGIDFGEKDDGFDKTHCSLFPKTYWENLFKDTNRHELVDKEEMEKGTFSESLLKGDGKVKLNIGCFTTMFHNGWTNIDILDMKQFAEIHKFQFCQHDVRNGLPYASNSVDAIMACHSLEHFTYQEGLSFLKECRRVLKPDGAMRILVPDALLLNEKAHNKSLGDLDEINDGCAASATQTEKLWALLHSGHQSAYDVETLKFYLEIAGFVAIPSSFRSCYGSNPIGKQILAETLDMLPCLSLYMEAYCS